MNYWTARFRNRNDVCFKGDDCSKDEALKHAKSLGDVEYVREATPGEIANLNDNLQRHTSALRYY